MNFDLITRWGDRLIEVAKRHETITFGDLAKHLGIASQGPWTMLDEIYDDEIAAGRPDLTLLVVRAATGYPPYVSHPQCGI
jgi:hypothetical protein